MDEASIPKIISVDDHVVAPAHVWERWLPAKYRDRGPRVERSQRSGIPEHAIGAESIHKIVRGDAIHLFELQGFQ